MADKKKFQQKANVLFEKYPEANKIFISENGQCFFDEKASKDYHSLKGFDDEPEVFFREGYENEDDSDVQEALHQSELERMALAGIVEEIAAVCDLDQDYEPAGTDTDETLTAVISLREKYTTAQRLLTEANTQLEQLSGVVEEKQTLEQQLEAMNKQMEALGTTTNTTKTRRNASQTHSTET